MKLISRSKYIGNIDFPTYTGRQHYMATTRGDAVHLPAHISVYESRVFELCNALNYRGVIHVTVDEKRLEVGQTQRKPELHVDGRFMKNLTKYNSEGGWGNGGWNHTCNEIPARMSVAVASSVARCKVYNGDFEGTPSEQGNLSHIRDQVGEGLLVPKNEWHLLSPDCVHESLPADKICDRSFIRVAFEDELSY